MSVGRIGLNCALSTPFDGAGAIDARRLADHARWVLANGCDGLTLFGTTGEGASIGIDERGPALAALAAAGIDLRARVLAGVGACAVADAVAQARIALEEGCRGILLAPPFFFPEPGDDGLYGFFAGVLDRLGARARDVFLYHLPSMTRAALSVELVRRLAEAFPGIVVGVKDSAGDWPATRRRLDELPDLHVVVGDERWVAQAVRRGGAGTICGLANIAPELMRPLAWHGTDDPRVAAMVEAIVAYPPMAALKALIAGREGDPGWRAMRPPLDPLPAEAGDRLAASLAAIRARPAA